MTTISQKAINLIVREEVSSREYYERHYTHPEWPKGASGITIGIGYDLGYQSAEKIKADWRGHVDDHSLLMMAHCAGVRGADAGRLLAEVRPVIVVPWDAAMAVFMTRDVPQWTSATMRALPNCEKLSATCLGVLVSISYNRGAAGWTSRGVDRYREMAAIRELMIAGRFDLIAAQIDSMARLWVGTSVAGVAERRHREASLFREGLTERPVGTTAPQAAPDPGVIASSVPDKTARTPAPKTTPAQNSATALATAAGASTAAAAAKSGVHWSVVVLILIVTVAVAGGGWWLWHKHRNPTPAPASA